MTVLLSELQPRHAAPDDPSLSILPPGTPFILRAALPAHQTLCQRILPGVFPLLRFCGFLGYFSAAASPGNFLLHTLKQLPIHNGLMMVFHIVHGTFAIVFPNLFTDAVRNIVFLQ